MLKSLGAESDRPIAGSARPIRSDEWAILTPQFQIAVRNHFRRINESSFYREDMRNYGALPLADWSLLFKPQMWAFFALPPGAAFSIYFAFFFAALLSGYYLLFRQLEAPAAFSIAASVIVFFSGFTQFWLTTFLPMIAVYPWVALLVLRPMPFWKKALIGAWTFPFFVFAHAYPPLLLTLVWCTIFLVLAFRPSLLRSPAELAALAIGAGAGIAVVYLYLAEVIPIMRNTVYPGHRFSPAGTTPWPAALSELFPFLAFDVGSFDNLTGENICEIGALGSFLPALTLCLTRYRALFRNPAALRAIAILLGGVGMMTLWEIAPVPAWIGRALLLDASNSTRWLFASGFLLTCASLVLWRENLISVDTRRLALFAGAGLIGSIALKLAWLTWAGEALPEIFGKDIVELELIGFAILAFLALRPATASRAPVLLGVVALLNVYAFGRFNPLQPARPIFVLPDSQVLRQLHADAAASDGGVLVDASFLGSTLNGLGFRSVDHYLLAPKLAIFRSYFPDMDAGRFNQIFNRSGHIQLIDGPVPAMQNPFMIGVPKEVFLPIRNVRRLEFGPGARSCGGNTIGAATRVLEQEDTITIEGWAPWRSEDSTQGIRVLTARGLRPVSLLTLTRSDIGEQLQDYRAVKAGFRLRVASVDGKALRASEVALVAFGAPAGEGRLRCCACP